MPAKLSKADEWVPWERERSIGDDGSFFWCAEMGTDCEPQAVCYVGSRGHLLPEDRHLVSLVHHYIISTYHNAGTIHVLSYVQWMNEWLQIFSFPKSSKHGKSITDACTPSAKKWVVLLVVMETRKLLLDQEMMHDLNSGCKSPE